jgi:hypothetical protein
MRKPYYAEFVENGCYHIYNRCISGEKLFKLEENYRYFLQQWQKYLGNYMATYAYALIPNHFHFLTKCKPLTAEIRKVIETENTKKAFAFLEKEIDYNTFIVSQYQRLFRSYVGAFNKQNNRIGNLFQDKFKRVSIKDAEHFRYIILYIHHNGIHHKLGKEYSDYPHTSYNQYLNIKPKDNRHLEDDCYPIRLFTEPVIRLFSDENEKSLLPFIKFHEENKNGQGLYPNLVKYKDSTIDLPDNLR